MSEIIDVSGGAIVGFVIDGEFSKDLWNHIITQIVATQLYVCDIDKIHIDNDKYCEFLKNLSKRGIKVKFS